MTHRKYTKPHEMYGYLVVRYIKIISVRYISRPPRRFHIYPLCGIFYFLGIDIYTISQSMCVLRRRLFCNSHYLSLLSASVMSANYSLVLVSLDYYVSVVCFKDRQQGRIVWRSSSAVRAPDSRPRGKAFKSTC